MGSGQMHRVYRNQAAGSYLSLYFLIFLSLQFSNIKIFVTLFSGTMRPRRLKHGTHVDNGQMYRAYRNRPATAYLSLYSFFFLSNFQTFKIFITLFSETGWPRRLKLGTHVDSGQMCIPESGCWCLLCLPHLRLGDILFLPGLSVCPSVCHKIVSAL